MDGTPAKDGIDRGGMGPMPHEIAVRTLGEIPGFRSYDPETREVEVEGWGRTRLPPGFLKADPKPSPTPPVDAGPAEAAPGTRRANRYEGPPVLGAIGDPEAMQALRRSVAGWISTDGRILSNTSNSLLRTMESIVTVPGLEDVMQNYEARTARHRRMRLAVIEARNRPTDPDAAPVREHPVGSPLAAGKHPFIRVMDTIRKAGWVPVKLCHLGETPSVIIEGGHIPNKEFEASLLALGRALDRQPVFYSRDEKRVAADPVAADVEEPQARAFSP